MWIEYNAHVSLKVKREGIRAEQGAMVKI